MKLLAYRAHDGQHRLSQWLAEDAVQPLAYPDGKAVDELATLIAAAVPLTSLQPYGSPLSPASLTRLAPIPRPARNLFCVGKNYAPHAREFTRSGFDASQNESIPTHPIVFSKLPQTVIAHGACIWDAAGVSAALDYEAELAVIIGHGGRGIARRDAMQHVWGYTILNDITARDWQSRHQQWHLGKSFDTFAPMGPVAVSADEIDGSKLDIRCWVNGELRQHANTRDLIFDIPSLIETISAGISLYPGDIIATGTPEGVGAGFTPPRFLQRGDVIAIEIEGIGRLENRVGVDTSP